MTAETVCRIVRMYGLEPSATHSMLSGYRNESYPVKLADGRFINVILYKREPDVVALIKRTNKLSSYLRAKQLPVRFPLDDRMMQLHTGAATRYAALYNFLNGSTIPWEAYTMEHLKLLGQSLAQLHDSVADYSDPTLPRVIDVCTAQCIRMERYFDETTVRQAVAIKLGLSVPRKVFTTARYILKNCEKLPMQPLHMDFVRSNILFSENPIRVVGILDFEKAAVGHPLFDIARTLAFLIVDCKYKPEPKIRKYFLLSGYQKRGKRQIEHIAVRTTLGRRPLLEYLIDFFLLHDLYKFLRHNPYESLADNEHFIRTRDLLLSRDVITTTTTGSQRQQELLQY